MLNVYTLKCISSKLNSHNTRCLKCHYQFNNHVNKKLLNGKISNVLLFCHPKVLKILLTWMS